MILSLRQFTLYVFLLSYGFLSHSSFVVTHAFVPAPSFHRPVTLCRVVSRLLANTDETTIRNDAPIGDDDYDDDNDDNDNEDISFLFDEPEPELEASEKAWRYAKKPLLRIGSKGATHAHGNSLRQLLEDHTVVRVKVNTKKFNNSVQQASETLKALAVENGAPADLEIIQIREGSKEIMFGMPGTVQRMEEGTFPPAPLIETEDQEEDEPLLETV